MRVEDHIWPDFCHRCGNSVFSYQVKTTAVFMTDGMGNYEWGEMDSIGENHTKVICNACCAPIKPKRKKQ